MNTRAGSFAGAAMMALVWALIWASPGMAIEAIANILPGALPFASEIDMWPQTLGLPGLVAGVLFSVLLVTTEGRRPLAELSLSRSGAWGAVAGLIVGALVVSVMDTGLSSPPQLASALAAIATVMGAAAGVGSALLCGYAGQKRASQIS